LEMENIDSIQEVAQKKFDGHITGHVTHFYGTCSCCMKAVE